MEEVVGTVELAPPKEKEEQPEVVEDKREEAVPENDVAKEVGVKQEHGSYNETKKGSGLFLWSEEQSTQRKKGREKECPQVFGAIMVDCVQYFFGLGDTISVQTVFFFLFFFSFSSFSSHREAPRKSSVFFWRSCDQVDIPISCLCAAGPGKRRFE
jgi:hypothetical protein